MSGVFLGIFQDQFSLIGACIALVLALQPKSAVVPHNVGVSSYSIFSSNTENRHHTHLAEAASRVYLYPHTLRIDSRPG